MRSRWSRAVRRRVVGRLSAVVAAVLVASMVAAVPVAAQDDAVGGFSDVTEGVHKPAIDALAAMGLFEGTECAEGMFCPGDEMKRWTMGVWLVRVLDEAEPPAATESSFADVESDEWWLAHVERLAELEVTKGCKTEPLAVPVAAQDDAVERVLGCDRGAVHKPAIDALAAMGLFEGTECAEGMFCPGDEMKRWTMGVWLVRVLDEAEPPAATESSFADVESDEWWLAHVERLAELEVTKGCKTEPLRFCPDRSVTRAQMDRDVFGAGV